MIDLEQVQEKVMERTLEANEINEETVESLYHQEIETALENCEDFDGSYERAIDYVERAKSDGTISTICKEAQAERKNEELYRENPLAYYGLSEKDFL